MDEDAGVTHAQIKSAIWWQAWAIVALTGVGGWAVLDIQGDVNTALARMDRIEESGSKAVENLAGAVSTQNSVLKDSLAQVFVKLEGINATLIRALEDQRRHEQMPVDRAHEK